MDRTADPEASLQMVELAHHSRNKAGMIGVGMDIAAYRQCIPTASGAV